MKKIKHTITRKSIPEVELISTTSQAWYDSNNNTIPWSGNTGYIPTGLTPYDGFVVYNTTGSLNVGYYIYNGEKWVQIDNSPLVKLENFTNRYPLDVSGELITGTTIENISHNNKTGYYEWGTPISSKWNFLGKKFNDHQIPVYLDSKVDEYGAMVDFDGYIAVESQLVPVNFIYFIDCETIEIVDTTNYNAFRDVEDFYFTIYWGDGTTSVINVGDTDPITHTYSSPGEKTVLVEWTTPYSTYSNISNVVCEFCFRITQEDHLIDGTTTSYIKTEQEINPGNPDYLREERQ